MTAGRDGKCRDYKLWYGVETVIGGSGNSDAQGSPGGACGGEAETTPFHFLYVISWEESELADPEQRDFQIPVSKYSALGQRVPEHAPKLIVAEL